MYLYIRVLYAYRTVFGESVHGVMNMKDEDGFEPTSESTHLSLPIRYKVRACEWIHINTIKVVR